MQTASPIVVNSSVGDLVAGKYRIERILSEGGMGCVVAARHTDLDELVAIKLLLPWAVGNSEAVARFAQEARTSVKIRSEHVVRTLDVGTLDNGTPFMVMEYLDGSDLSAVLRERGSLPVEQAIDFILQASEAIAEAHRMGIVHRDLKPANLFCIRQPGGMLLIKVLDFGISKVTNGQIAHPLAVTTNTATIMGSPFYMSPEQLRSSRSVDVRSDIWSLGVILFELLSGRLPFGAETLPELCLEITTKSPPRLREYCPSIEPELEDVICKCLEKDREARYSNIAEFALALTPFAPVRCSSSVQRVCGIMCSCDSPEGTGRGASLHPSSEDLLAAAHDHGLESRDTRALHAAPTSVPAFTSSQTRVGPNVFRASDLGDEGRLPVDGSMFPAVLSPTGHSDSNRSPSTAKEQPRARNGRKLLATVLVLAALLTGAVRALAPVSPHADNVLNMAARALTFLHPQESNIAVTVAGPGLIPIEDVEVFVDGKKRCNTSPCSTPVGPGTHLVTVNARGYVAISPQAVAAGTPLNLVLTPVSNIGSLQVTGGSAAITLFLDGREVGTLPVELLEVTAGTHHLRMESGGRFEAYEQSVLVTPDQLTTIGPIRLKVRKGTATIIAGANAEHARLQLISGSARRQLTTLPHVLELDTSKPYTIVATKRGFHSTVIPVAFEDGIDRKEFVVALRRFGESAIARENASSQQSEAAKQLADNTATGVPETRSEPSHSTLAAESSPSAEGGVQSDVLGASSLAQHGGDITGSDAPAAGLGMISINSIPRSNVLLDGRPLGATPRAEVAVSPGDHVVTFVHPEYGRKQVVVRAIAGEAIVTSVHFP
ncbi:MAG: protein kinase domain-containing protein [Myxococcales bacterium]